MVVDKADVVVIGAGILGTFHAYFAARKGCKTVLIERNPFPTDASVRNFGIIARSIVAADSPWAAYARTTMALYRALQQEHDLSVRATGSLYLASTDAERHVLQEFAQADRAEGAEGCSRYLEADEVRQRVPVIREAYCRGALLFPDDLTVEPGLLLRALIPHLVRQGLIAYRPGTTVVNVERSGSGCLVIDSGGTTIAADHVVICSGTEYRTLFPAAFAQSGLRLCTLQMMQTTPQPPGTVPHALLSGLSIRRYPAFRACPSYPALLDEAVDPDVWAHGIHLLFKQALGGGVVVGDSHHYAGLAAADRRAESTEVAVNAAILSYGRRMVELPSWTIERLWNGYYLEHPDREIYAASIGEAIHLVTGIGGKGMTTGPGYAQHAIDTILA